MRPHIDAIMPYVHALYTAREAVKQQLRAQGHIVAQYRPATLSAMAKELFERDRERLLAEAREQIARWAKRPA
jgi:hypothetical protein